MEKIYRVYNPKSCRKKLAKMPKEVRIKTAIWVNTVEFNGVTEARKIPGYHDEPLQGQRFGQRSIRLNRGYRLIYKENKSEKKIFILEVTKHEY